MNTPPHDAANPELERALKDYTDTGLTTSIEYVITQREQEAYERGRRDEFEQRVRDFIEGGKPDGE